ncbi:MAG: bactofilin family protein [Terriglobales bacterium]
MATTNPARPESSHLGKSFQFKGDISGTEDIYIDGEVEGTIQLPNQIVTIGPNGSVSADILARELIVHGKVKGNANAQDRIEVGRSGSVLGDMAMARISIQDGAFIQGRVDICVGGNLAYTEVAAPALAEEPSPVLAASVPPLSNSAASTPAPGAASGGGAQQGRLLDRHV